MSSKSYGMLDRFWAGSPGLELTFSLPDRDKEQNIIQFDTLSAEIYLTDQSDIVRARVIIDNL